MRRDAAPSKHKRAERGRFCRPVVAAIVQPVRAGCAVVGLAKCLMESKSKEAAKTFLEETTRSCLDANELRKVLEEVESLNK